MRTFRNDFGEGRIVPHIGYHLVEPGQTVQVPDEEAEHWVAGGWTPVDEALTTAAVAPAKTVKAPEGAAE